MNSQLPQNLQTSKFNSLPDDLRKAAEELISDKFDIAEVVEDGGRKKSNDFFGHHSTGTSPFPLNMIRGEMRSRSGQRYSFMTQVSPSMNLGTQGSYSNKSSDSSLEPIAIHIEDTIRNYAHKFQQDYRDYVSYIRIEINGHGAEVHNFSDIMDLVNAAFNKDRGYHAPFDNWKYL